MVHLIFFFDHYMYLIIMSLHYVCTCTFVLFDNWDLLTFCVCMYIHMYLCIYNYIYVWKHISRLVHFVRPCHLIKSEILHLNAIKTIVSYLVICYLAT